MGFRVVLQSFSMGFRVVFYGFYIMVLPRYIAVIYREQLLALFLLLRYTCFFL